MRIVLLLCVLASSAIAEDKPLSRIAFGSCAKQDKPQPIWNSIVKAKPDAFLFIGDNIYGDTTDMEVLKKKWAMLGAKEGFKKLRNACPILAVWDDHDYGANDAGVEYPKKKESQKIFLDFFNEPADSPRRKREGIYLSKTYGPAGKRVQIILLDTRYFRSKLKMNRKFWKGEPGSGRHGWYVKNTDPGATILGEAQWKWLAGELKKPAEIRIIASSIQVVPEQHGWESWSRIPAERKRLLELLSKTKANGVVFVSGDRHAAEISRLSSKASGVSYPLFDVTSSSLNSPSKWRNELNRHRVGIIYNPINFGLIEIDWSKDDPSLRLQVRDGEGKPVLQAKTTVSKLRTR